MSFYINGDIVYHGKNYDCEQLVELKEKVRINIRRFCGSGKTVALSMKRTPVLLITIFALLDEKIPFLPIDILYPEDRLCYMLDKAGVDIVISDENDSKKICGRSVLHIMVDFRESASRKAKNIISVEEENDDEALAYLLFTSGTTGLPKAVEVRRKGLINFVQGIPEVVAFPNDSRIACMTSQTFDIFFLESVMALCTGMTVVLADDVERANPRMIIKLLEENYVNVMQSTPSALRMIQMIDTNFECLKYIDTIMVGGEKFPLSLLSDLQKSVKGKIYNMYGPTETTIWSTVANLTKSQIVHIGHPIKDTQIYIMDDSLQEMPEGVEGEILIAGAGVAKGYCNDVEKTDKQFVIIEKDNVKIRAYKTGDLGCLSDTGVYMCGGRKDDQVKVLGHRIELGDVEGNIQKIKGVKNAMVAVSPEDENHLVCFYVAEKILENKYLNSESLKVLPNYMIPNRWLQVPELLYTASQKSDRKSMVEKYWYNKENVNIVERASVEHKAQDNIYDLLLRCLQLTKQDGQLDTELVSLGIDSVQFVERMVDVEENFDFEFEDEMLTVGYFRTIGDLLEYIREVLDERKNM